MNYDRQKRLVERLLEKSRAGELAWQEGVDDDEFQVSFSRSSAQISPSSRGQTGTYRLEVIDSYGRIAESFSDEELSRDGESHAGTWHDIMREIFDIARRRALKADEVLDGILAEMDSRYA